MITIEERAEKAYPIKKADFEEYAGYNTYADLYGDQQEAYIKGATEQQQIDIVRHCNIFQSFLIQCCGYKKDVAQQMIGQLKHALGYDND